MSNKQLTFTYSKSAIRKTRKRFEICPNIAIKNQKDVCEHLNIWTYFTPYSSVSVVYWLSTSKCQQGMFKINDKDTRATSIDVILLSLLLSLSTFNSIFTKLIVRNLWCWEKIFVFCFIVLKIIMEWITTQKWSFPLRVSSVNVIKSAVSCGFGHISWRKP